MNKENINIPFSDEDFLSDIDKWFILTKEYIESGYYEFPYYLMKRLSDILEAKKFGMSRFDIIAERERNRQAGLNMEDKDED